MGQQVRFYMTHEDEVKFIEELRQKADIDLVYNTFFAENKMVLNPFVPVGLDVYACNTSLLNKTITHRIAYRYIQEQSYFCVDVGSSEVIQFNRSKLDGQRHRSGRLWFDERTLMGEPKSDAFIKWANAVLRWIRTHYKKKPDDEYYGPHALALSETGQVEFRG